jgi:hypothetical protein
MQRLAAQIMRQMIEEIMVYTNPLVDARKKELGLALVCILEPHTVSPPGETEEYFAQVREQMNAVGIVFPDEGWLRRLAQPQKECLLAIEMCMEWIPPDVLIDANILESIFTHQAFDTLLPCFRRKQSMIADRIALFHPFFSQQALQFIQNAQSEDKDKLIWTMGGALLGPKYTEDLPSCWLL